MARPTRLLTALSAGDRDRLMEHARDATFPQDARIFDENGEADRFWIIRSGTVALDLRIPGRRPATVDTLGMGDLLGWSWLFPPQTWHFGARAFSPVRAHEFRAAEVRALCEADHTLGFALALAVAEILSQRVEVARAKLLDEYVRHGAPGL